MNTHMHKKGSLLGAILLIAGCCIGAGMLGLPVLSALAGFSPSLIMFVLVWLFMVGTGLVLLEVNLSFKRDIHIVSMTDHILGKWGKITSWFVFLFLFYSLMVAYIAASGSLIAEFINNNSSFALSHSMGSLVFCLFFGFLIYSGTSAFDWVNRLLMLGLVISYVGLVSGGLPHIQWQLLQHQDWNAAALVVPALIVSFGYHNLIPSLTTYLNYQPKMLVKAIIIGSAIPLTIYLIWEMLILGIVPLNNFQQAINEGEIVTQALKASMGTSWVLEIAESFAFFAILTSLLSVSLSFVDFLADGLNIHKTHKGKLILAILILAPPFVFSLAYPQIFLVALNYAGGFGTMILFGILPILMLWKGRYIQQWEQPKILPGGKITLIVMMICSLAVIGWQLYNSI